MKEKEAIGASIYGLNSDAMHLSVTKAEKRLLLGYNLTGGLGCGGFPERGARSAEESEQEIRQLIQGAGLVFLTAGLGGGTGTGATPVIAKIAESMGAVTLSVVTIPFQVERTRLVKAKEGLKRLVEACDAVIVIDNSRLRKAAGTLPLQGAFGVANALVASFIKNVSETIAVPSLMSLDFADFKSIMVGSGVCAVGFGEGQGETKVEDAVERALTNQLLDIGDTRKSVGALVHIEGGDDMTLEDINRAGEILIERLAPTAKVSWGARINSKMEGTLRASVVLAGVDSPFLVDELQAFGAVKGESAVPLEVELTKSPQRKGAGKGFFSRILSK